MVAWMMSTSAADIKPLSANRVKNSAAGSVSFCIGMVEPMASTTGLLSHSVA
jgi:hypothetical protein